MNATGIAPPTRGEPVSIRNGAVWLTALGFALATQIALALTFGAWPAAPRQSWLVAIVLCLFLSLPAAGVILATWRARCSPVDWRITLAVALTGLAMRLPYFGAGAMMEDDHFRYLLDGAMVAHGLSPYAHAPEALLGGVDGVPNDLVEAGRSAIASINFPHLRSIYPGTAQALFALSYLLAPWSIDGLRLMTFAAETLTAALIWRTLVLSGREPLHVALYWCNPLMAFCLTGQAHVDAAIAPALLIGLLAAHRRAGALAGTSLGIAVGVKLWPILLAPLMARALWPDRRALVAFAMALGAAAVALCGPLMWASLAADAGLIAYAGSWTVNNAPFAWASVGFVSLFGASSWNTVLRALVVLLAGCASLAVAARRPEGLQDIVGRATILAAALFYLSPAQFPWYAAWFLPLAAASGNWILAAGAVGLPIYYLFFPLAVIERIELHSHGIAALHLVPLILAALILRRPTAPRLAL